MQFKEKTLARIYSFKFLYFLLFEKGVDSTTLEQIDLTEEISIFSTSLGQTEKEEPSFKITDKSLFFSKQIIESAITSREKILAAITEYTNGKCNKVENAIIHTALAEQFSSSDLPKKVLLNEYIELAKQFGTKSSASFINAFLDKSIK